MKTYMITIDQKDSNAFLHEHIEAATTCEAMAAAEKFLDENAYQITIAERTGRPNHKLRGCAITLWLEVLTNRGHGWKICDKDHGERPATWEEATCETFPSTWKIINL